MMLRSAFAGDGIEKELVRRLAVALDLRLFVETGTWTGKTALWLGREFPGASVLTCEVLPGVFEAAKKRLRHQPNVECFLAESGEWVATVCSGPAASKPAFFFLDAHGMSSDSTLDLPLGRELESIRQLRSPAVVIVDDFLVPGRPDFAFCVNGVESSFAYPEDERMLLERALSLDLIAPWLSSDDRVLLPAYSYDDALTYQDDPLHANLIGYALILHMCDDAMVEVLLRDPLIAKNYTVAR